MNSNDYERLRELYDELFELSAGEQRQYLAELDLAPSFREELAGLLGQDAGVGAFSEERLGELGAQLIETPHEASSLPTSIGEYRVLRKLGEGGMGVVYAAHRGDESVVAIKVLRPEVATDWASKRFAREAEVLRQLRHPGIAEFFESGEAPVEYGTETRVLPYLAMELVEGEPLHDYARREKLRDRQRLELMARVCDAVQHAHEAGVVHRDLKPANLLVGAVRGDAIGRPKVLDFGIARASSVDLNTLTVTQSGALLGTVPYMSPEQVGGGSSKIDKASDVYALGVVLFELLAGRLPYNVRNRPLLEAARVIQEEEPTRLGSVAARLRGDVEVIVGKALEKEPGRRYASAAELARDLRSHLRGEPIEARPATWRHQVGKFARRHKALVGTVTGALIALAVGLAATLWFAVGQTRARELADVNALAVQRLAYRMGVDGAATALSLGDGRAAAHQLENVPVELRGWEWQHLESRLDRSVARLDGFRLYDGNHCIAFSPDGERVHILFQQEAAVTLVSWAPEDGTVDERTEHGVGRVRFGQGGGRVAWRREEPRRVVVEDLTDGSLQTLTLGDGESVMLGSDHEQALVFGDGRVRRVELGTGRELGEPQQFEKRLNVANTSIGGDRGAWCTDTGVLQVASLDGEFTWELGDIERGLPRLSPDGRLVALSPANSSYVLVLDLDAAPSAGARTVLEAHRDEVRSYVFSPDSTRLATAGEDQTVILWDPRTGERLRSISLVGVRVEGLAFAPDGRRLAGLVAQRDGYEIQVWSTAAVAERVVRHDHALRAMSSTADSELVYVAGEAGRVSATDVRTGYEVARYEVGGPGSRITGLDSSPVDRWVAIIGRTKVIGRWARILDPATGETRDLLESIAIEAALAFSPNGRHLAVWHDEQITLFETESWKAVATHSPGLAVRHGVVAYAPRGDRIVLGSDAGTIAILDAHDLTELRRWDGHENRIWTLAFHPVENILGSGGTDRTFKLWDLTAPVGAPPLLELLQDRIVHSLSFSPDGERLAVGSADRSVRLFETRDYTELVQLQEHADAVRVALFTPDGQKLVSCSGDGALRIRGFETVAELAELREEYRLDLARFGPRVEGLLREAGPEAAWDTLEADTGLGGRERAVALQLVMRRHAAPGEDE